MISSSSQLDFNQGFHDPLLSLGAGAFQHNGNVPVSASFYSRPVSIGQHISGFPIPGTRSSVSPVSRSSAWLDSPSLVSRPVGCFLTRTRVSHSWPRCSTRTSCDICVIPDLSSRSRPSPSLPPQVSNLWLLFCVFVDSFLFFSLYMATNPLLGHPSTRLARIRLNPR